MRRILSTAAALVFTGVALAGCGSTSKSEDSAATTAAKSGTTLTLVAKNIAFDQSTLSATAGDSVTFVIKNEDNTEHNLTIADLKVDKDAEAGKSAKQTVTNLKPGTYQYHCEYHPTQMNGTLTVS
ncbi:MAG TPA: cupredoxin domain-containing protein [Acidimicrobiales bacterium]|nr:cupredoxin domain-containing protein [Acidimicrobiales bacterium]